MNQTPLHNCALSCIDTQQGSSETPPIQVWWVSHMCVPPFLQDGTWGRVYFSSDNYFNTSGVSQSGIQVRVLLFITGVAMTSFSYPLWNDSYLLEWWWKLNELIYVRLLTGHLVQRKTQFWFEIGLNFSLWKWGRRWCGNIPFDHPFIQQVLLEDISCLLTDQVQKLFWVHETQANGLQTVTW